ncbi:putative nicotinamide phosphoribosyltransferase [Aeromonas phage phiA8-29]|uniref:Nicotinamide phosphoribosyltransferase n=1 Tax=Aeromonas phage phiA8-29 TaxID=1978922 RepID=A0A1W6DY18_9CAUD|nr:nicotinamide phosphoribosyl transferase [Aeromonas phage phiA8-29]ARK07907.1 putative nicotinamide phosphoribosyltransferase [Aeromonas phage phiA8-29]
MSQPSKRTGFLNALEALDFYKVGHKFQYPEGTEWVYSNWTARSDKHMTKLEGIWDGKAVHYGIEGLVQQFLVELFDETFFKVPKEEAVGQYSSLIDGALGTHVDTAHIEALHDLGYLPLLIKSLPEGMRVPMRVPTTTIQNTLPSFYWLVNYIETLFSNSAWFPSTVASIAWQYAALFRQYAELTGSPMDFTRWQGHDFSYRGVPNPYAAAGLSGHLLSFHGTDTVPAIRYLKEYYKGDETFVGGSVPATEHSVMCMGGQETEIETFKRLINDVYPSGIVSIVSDTWDFWDVVTNKAQTLKDDIMARGGKVVFRPDSGDPADILCGFPYVIFNSETSGMDQKQMAYNAAVDAHVAYFIDAATGKGYHTTPTFYITEVDPRVIKGAVQCLWEIFGGTQTSRGYRVLDSHVGLIYGDSITLEVAQDILKRLEKKGFASCNVVFGIGSFTYQYITRDTLGYAIKATAGIVNGEYREIFKDPKTGDGMKKSAKGYLRVTEENGELVLHDQQDHTVQYSEDLLEPIFLDGKRVRHTSLAEIRQRLWGEF